MSDRRQAGMGHERANTEHPRAYRDPVCVIRAVADAPDPARARPENRSKGGRRDLPTGAALQRAAPEMRSARARRSDLRPPLRKALGGGASPGPFRDSMR